MMGKPQTAPRRSKYRYPNNRVPSPHRRVRLLVWLCWAVLTHQIPRAGGTL